MFSGRAHPRSQGIRPGLISIDGANSTHQCTLDDYNEAGARISVFNPDQLPDEFLVISRAEDLCARCRVVWRRDNDLGVAFEHRGSFQDAVEMRQRLGDKVGRADAFQDKPAEAVKPARPKAARPSSKPRKVLRNQYRFLEAECSLLALDPKRGITLADVKSAYRTRALKLHPDQGGSPEAFQALSQAYQKLLQACKVAAAGD